MQPRRRTARKLMLVTEDTMRIHDIMSTDLITAAPGELVENARNRMRDHGVHHLLITQGGRLLGVVSDRDLSGQASTATVGALSQKEVVRIGPDATLRDAAAVMDGHEISCLPVLEDGQLQGIVTSRDLIHALAKGATRPAPQSERKILRKRGPRKRPQPAI